MNINFKLDQKKSTGLKAKYKTSLFYYKREM